MRQLPEMLHSWENFVLSYPTQQYCAISGKHGPCPLAAKPHTSLAATKVSMRLLARAGSQTRSIYAVLEELSQQSTLPRESEWPVPMARAIGLLPLCCEQQRGPASPALLRFLMPTVDKRRWSAFTFSDGLRTTPSGENTERDCWFARARESPRAPASLSSASGVLDYLRHRGSRSSRLRPAKVTQFTCFG